MADQIESRIPDDLDGVRLDKALSSLLDLSRARARTLIERGATIDGVPASPSTRVNGGELVVTGVPEPQPELKPEPVDFVVLYEDGEVLVVDKPAGLVVHPGAGRHATTLAAGLLHRYPEIEGVGSAGRWGIVHRLDRDTSGTLIVARTDTAHDALAKQIKRRRVGRSYLALVDGVPGSPTGTIDAPIGPDPARPMRRAVVQGAKPARTHFVVERAFDQKPCALLNLSLETGRTHQIRVHLSAIGHPVIGDRVYGKPSPVDSPRMFLHALAVEFEHPSLGERVRVEAPLPEDLQKVLDRLEAGQ